MENVVSPVDFAELKELLELSGYDQDKTQFLVNGFQNGFSIGYEGPKEVKITSPNLKITVGSKLDLWNKVMAEVKEGRYAGPYSTTPFEHFIQSPIGLVPKDKGTKTRLIFHLSYPRLKTGPQKSVNGNTPKEKCTVKYKDIEHAIRLCIELGKACKLGKSDMSHAFRNLGICKAHWRYLVMKAESPFDHKMYYFVDKCLPFGAAISCAIFQAFSDAVAFIVEWLTGDPVINYLDDFLFIAMLLSICNNNLQTFLDVCERIKFPVSLEKTHWGTTQLTFLGMLLDTVEQKSISAC